MKPEEAWNIDTKMDDGRPGTGKVASWKNGYGGWFCSSTGNPATAVYELSRSTVECHLQLVIF